MPAPALLELTVEQATLGRSRFPQLFADKLWTLPQEVGALLLLSAPQLP